MISGTITFRGAGYAVLEGNGHKIVDGKPTEEEIPLKLLQVSDLHSGLKVDLVFTDDDFTKFVEAMHGAASKIVRPSILLPGDRNGS